MSLVSYEFLAFFAVAAILYYVVPKRFQWILLLAVSFLFYAGGGAVYLLYPMITAVSTWFLALRIGRADSAAQTYIQEQKPDKEQKKAYQAQIKKHKKRLMTAGILLNFGILAVLKYTDFLLGNLNVDQLGASAGYILLYLSDDGLSDRCLPRAVSAGEESVPVYAFCHLFSADGQWSDQPLRSVEERAFRRTFF